MEALVVCWKLGSINASPVASKALPSWSSDHAGQTSWIPMRMLWPCREHDLRGNYHSTWSWMSTCAACFGEMFRAEPWRACSGCFAQILGRHRCPWAFVMLSAAFVSVRRKFVVRCAALLRRSSTCSAPRPLRACGKHGSSCKLSTTHRRGILLRTTWSLCTGFDQQPVCLRLAARLFTMLSLILLCGNGLSGCALALWYAATMLL